MDRYFPLALSAAVVAIDQVSKQLFESMITDLSSALPIFPFLNFVFFENRGVSFGFLSSEEPWAPYILAIISLGIVAGLAVWLQHSKDIRQRFALCTIIGGAVSNVIDRVRDGAVTDFLDFHLQGYHFPAFNAADAAITIGTVLLILIPLFSGKPPAMADAL